MNPSSWLLIIAGITLIAVLLFFLETRKKKPKIDYYTLFIIAVIWLASGIAADNYFLLTLGLIGTLIALANKEEWKPKQKKLTRREERTRIIVLISLLVIFIIALMLYFMF